MKLITQRELIRTVAARWKRQYQHFDDDKPLFSYRNGFLKAKKNKKDIGEKLEKLNVETATPADVTEIIGNNSWTRLICDECQEETDALITVGVGEDLDYESNTASICKKCTDKAASLFRDDFDSVVSRIRAMTKEERIQSLINCGILNVDGKLSDYYLSPQ